MSKPRIFTALLMATALLAGDAPGPEPPVILYKMANPGGGRGWGAWQESASNKKDGRGGGLKGTQRKKISNPGNVQPGTELVIRVKELN